MCNGSLLSILAPRSMPLVTSFSLLDFVTGMEASVIVGRVGTSVVDLTTIPSEAWNRFGSRIRLDSQISIC
jgi:hypothetical protein